jgi:hypothetical protein
MRLKFLFFMIFQQKNNFTLEDQGASSYLKHKKQFN